MAYRLPRTHAALLREVDHVIEAAYCDMMEALAGMRITEDDRHLNSGQKADERIRVRLVTEDALRRTRVAQAMREVTERRKAEAEGGKAKPRRRKATPR